MTSGTRGARPERRLRKAIIPSDASGRSSPPCGRTVPSPSGSTMQSCRRHSVSPCAHSNGHTAARDRANCARWAWNSSGARPLSSAPPGHRDHHAVSSYPRIVAGVSGRILPRFVIACAVVATTTMGGAPPAAAWSNGVDGPDTYGTHDWILDHALDALGRRVDWVCRRAAFRATDDPDTRDGIDHASGTWWHVWDEWARPGAALPRPSACGSGVPRDGSTPGGSRSP
jgi:hypothetical protein